MSTPLEEPAVIPSFPDMPAPAPEHAWLERFVGEWTSEAEINCPGQPPMLCKGTESARMLGGFWLVAQGSSEMGGAPFASVLTLGYNPQTKSYLGSWVDSMTSHFWHYVNGTLDATGNVLTLETEAECPANPGRLSKFRERTEFRGADHRVFTSSIEGEDGAWSTVVTVNFHRKP